VNTNPGIHREQAHAVFARFGRSLGDDARLRRLADAIRGQVRSDDAARRRADRDHRSHAGARPFPASAAAETETARRTCTACAAHHACASTLQIGPKGPRYAGVADEHADCSEFLAGGRDDSRHVLAHGYVAGRSECAATGFRDLGQPRASSSRRFLDATVTAAPSAASLSAIARPKPRPAPVTIAVSPASRPLMPATLMRDNSAAKRHHFAPCPEGETVPTITSIADLRALARKRVPRAIFDYCDRGSYDEVTLRRNRSDYEAIEIRQRVAVDVSAQSLATTLVGQPAAMPLGIAPTGLAASFTRWRDRRRARRAGLRIPFCLSTVSICSIEDVHGAVEKPFWFQLYLMRDRAFNEELIARAKAAQCSALVLTLDLQMQGVRRQDIKNGLSIPPRLTLRNALEIAARPAWALGVLLGKRRTFGNLAGRMQGSGGLATLSEWIGSQFDPTVSWKDVEWVRKQWPGKLVLKASSIRTTRGLRARRVRTPSSSRITADVSSTARRSSIASLPELSRR